MNKEIKTSRKSWRTSRVARAALALLLAIVTGTVVSSVVPHLYAEGILTMDVSDGEGHGPDRDSREWRGAVESGIASDSILFALLSGAAVFTVSYILTRPGALAHSK